MGRPDRCVSLDINHGPFGAQSGHPLAIIGLQGFFPLKGQAAVGVGALEVPSTERKRLATLSVSSRYSLFSSPSLISSFQGQGIGFARAATGQISTACLIL